MKDKDSKLLEEAYDMIQEEGPQRGLYNGRRYQPDRNDGEEDGVPYRIVNGVKMFIKGYISRILDPNDEWEYSKRRYYAKQWAEDHDAIFYSMPRDEFNIYIAAKLAKEAGKTAAVVEDLS